MNEITKIQIRAWWERSRNGISQLLIFGTFLTVIAIGGIASDNRNTSRKNAEVIGSTKFVRFAEEEDIEHPIVVRVRLAVDNNGKLIPVATIEE